MIEKRLDADNREIEFDIRIKIAQFGNSRNRRTENQQQNRLDEQHRISGY